MFEFSENLADLADLGGNIGQVAASIAKLVLGCNWEFGTTILGKGRKVIVGINDSTI